MRYKKRDLKMICEIYGKKGCNMSATALALKISRKTLYTWRKKYEALDEAMTDVEESLLDNVESKLISHINNDDVTSLIFFLKTKGRSRGYIEKYEQEVTVNPFIDVMKRVAERTKGDE